MSSFEFTGTKFDLKGSIRGDLIKIGISPTALISVDLLNEIGKAVAKEGVDNSRGLREFVGKSTDPLPADIARTIAYSVNRINYAYYAYYVGLLKGMDNLLKSPGVLAKPHSTDQKTEAFNKTVILPLPGMGRGLGKSSDRVTLSGNWKGLSETTMKAKNKLAGPKVFWKHTGKSSQAFHAAVTARLKLIKPKDFMVSNSAPPTVVKESSAKIGKGKYVASASYKFEMGVPNWDAKMDTFITVPFATLKSESTIEASGLLYDLEVKAQASGAFDPKANVKTAELTGIDRILMAEAHRPWLRDLSAQAGSRLQSFITGKSVTAGKSVIGIAAVNSKAKALLKAKKNNQLQPNGL